MMTVWQIRRSVRCLASAVLVLLCSQILRTDSARAADTGAPVDLALLLAIDCSGSVDAIDYRLQMDGLAAAFANPDLATAIAIGRHGRIAVSATQWSDREQQHIVLPWTLIESAEQSIAIAAHFAAMPRLGKGGSTSISTALIHGIAYLRRVPVAAERRVIDISGDGENNDGPIPETVRDLAIADGITINGLAILSDAPRLDSYYRYSVIGGPGAFVIAAKNFESYRAAILAKLLREVQSPVAAIPPRHGAFSLAVHDATR